MNMLAGDSISKQLPLGRVLLQQSNQAVAEWPIEVSG
jgi:hypothetical protein